MNRPSNYYGINPIPVVLYGDQLCFTAGSSLQPLPLDLCLLEDPATLRDARLGELIRDIVTRLTNLEIELTSQKRVHGDLMELIEKHKKGELTFQEFIEQAKRNSPKVEI